MPEANQYIFSHRELLKILIREAEVREGKWMLLMNFSFTAGNLDLGVAGQNAPSGNANPGIATVVQNIGIQKADQMSPPSLTMDASEVYTEEKS